jgi:predicted small lipoprotein YifL
LGRRLAVVALLLTLAGCGGARLGPTYPPAGATPLAATSETAAARAAVIRAVGPTGLVVAAAAQPYRPPEGAWFASAPRTVIELDAPGGGALGFIVVYGFGSAGDAATAAADQASYVSRPTGRVYFPNDARFVLRVVGTSAVFFTWSPGSGDSRLADVQTALEGLGTGVPVAG